MEVVSARFGLLVSSVVDIRRDETLRCSHLSKTSRDAFVQPPTRGLCPRASYARAALLAAWSFPRARYADCGLQYCT